MKIAVIGTGPLAIEFAILMHRQDAHVTLFGESQLGGNVIRHSPISTLSMEGKWSEVTTEDGREIAALKVEETIPSLEEYYRHYLKSLINYCEENIEIKKFNVQRVQKRFLSLQDEVPGKSRLEDLFRVVHTRVDEEGEIEFFDDFDIVVEAIGAQAKIFAGPAGGLAINEKFNQNEIYYQLGNDTASELLDFRGTIALVGEGIESASLLLFLKTWLSLDTKNNLYLVQDNERPFEKLCLDSPELDKEITNLIKEEKVLWQKDCREVEIEIENYRLLPREEQIKFRMSEFPEPRLKILTEYTVTSIDHLTDREGLFLTLESPTWKGSDRKEIFTLNCGKLFVLKGSTASYLAQNMRTDVGPLHSEPGYYTLGQNQLHEKGQYLLKEALPNIFSVRDNILSFFTRVNT